ncbi:MAG: radical SAM protein [Solobacterium sp.]|nr:radical SAM protein [Solobacterium sp.]
MSEIICPVCPHHCHIPEGGTGACRARGNRNGQSVPLNYGKLTSLAIDPIEKKPLAHFYPGSWILSAGSFGCNFACPFCQNHTISMHGENDSSYYEISPAELAGIALKHTESIGIAFTYNEPTIGWEYIRDTAELVKPFGQKIVLVTNGCVSEDILEELLPYVDAMNIDLKGDRAFYRELHGDYDTVKHTIERAQQKCHVEVTTLVIPGKNDRTEWIREEARWLASLDRKIVLHLSRYFPRYRYSIPATDIVRMREMKKAAEEYLDTVLLGNV